MGRYYDYAAEHPFHIFESIYILHYSKNMIPLSQISEKKDEPSKAVPVPEASIDRYDVLLAVLTCTAGLVVAFLMSFSDFTGDFWCHLSWMRITNRLPMAQWYDDNKYTHLDYPVLAGYFHYYMAYVYRYFDPIGFFTSNIKGIGVEKPELKRGGRMAIMALNMVTYFPTVSYVVLSHFKAYSRVFKMSTLFFLLVFPMYAYIEFSSAQANGPHLSFLVLSIYCLATDRLRRATVFFTLSLCYKHVVGPLVVPIAVYIIAREWHLVRLTYKDSVLKAMVMYVYRLVSHAVLGCLTLLAVCAPMLLHPPAFQNMINVITHFMDRGYLHPTPSFWNVFNNYYSRRVALESILPPNKTFYIHAAAALFGAPFVMWRPNHRVLAAYYTVIAITLYLFGFAVHEKHIHYACLTILLYPHMYKGFHVYLFGLTTASLLPTVCLRHSDTSLWLYGTFFTLYSVYYEYWVLPRAKEKDGLKPNWIQRNSGRITAAAVASSLCLIFGYVVASTMNKHYKCTFYSEYEDVLMEVLFGWHFLFYLYTWVVFFREVVRDEPAGKEVQLATPESPQKY